MAKIGPPISPNWSGVEGRVGHWRRPGPPSRPTTRRGRRCPKDYCSKAAENYRRQPLRPPCKSLVLSPKQKRRTRRPREDDRTGAFFALAATLRALRLAEISDSNL